MSNIKLVEIKTLATYEIKKISKEQKCSLNKHLTEAIVFERSEAEEFLWVNPEFTQYSSAVIYQFGFNFEHSMEEVQYQNIYQVSQHQSHLACVAFYSHIPSL